MIGKLDTLLGHGVLLSAQGAKTGRINVRECTPGLDLLRHYGNETSGGRCLHGILSGPFQITLKTVLR